MLSGSYSLSSQIFHTSIFKIQILITSISTKLLINLIISLLIRLLLFSSSCLLLFNIQVNLKDKLSSGLRLLLFILALFVDLFPIKRLKIFLISKLLTLYLLFIILSFKPFNILLSIINKYLIMYIPKNKKSV